MLYTSSTSFTDREQLKTFPVPTLDQLREKRGDTAGNRWQPQQFFDVANSIVSAAERRGLVVAAEHYDTSKDGFDVFGAVRFEGTVQGRDDMAPVLGWRMSNMQRFRLLGVSGAHVFVCANGMITGDFCFGHKLSSKMDRDVTVDEGFDKWRQQQRRIAEVYATMENVDLEPRDVDHVLMTAVRERIIASSQLGKIDAEFGSDRNVSQFGERPTVRRLYEAVTEVGKTWRSPRVVERGLRGFPDMALRLYGQEALADALTEGALAEPSLN